MIESINLMLDRFHLTKVPSLPKMILHGLNLQDSDDPNKAISQLLSEDPLLLAKVIDTYSRRNLRGLLEPTDLANKLGSDKIQAIISQTALFNCFNQVGSERLAFLKGYCRFSNRAVHIASGLSQLVQPDLSQEAVFCARFLKLGELILESSFSGQYRQLHQSAESESAKAHSEKQSFGYNHAELGNKLLERWKFEASICESVLYQSESLEQVLDASSLVKICWLTNLLADQNNSEEKLTDAAIRAAQQLFDLTTEDVKSLYVEIKNNSFLEKQEFNDSSAQEEIKQKIQYTSLFNTVFSGFNKGGAFLESNKQEMGLSLGENVNLLFGVTNCIVFKGNSESNVLKSYIDSLPQNITEEIKISCQQNRSTVADSFLQKKEITVDKLNQTLSVVDKQLLTLLGTQTMVCEPILKNDQVLGVLVLGITQIQNETYKRQTELRSLLNTELAKQLTPELNKVANNSDEKINTEQRISDAIHEANNPLSIIKNYLQLLSIKQEGQDAVLEDINIIKTEIDRVSNILTKLKNQQPVVDELKEIQVNNLVENLNKVFVASIYSEKSLTVNLELDPLLPRIKINENALKQILTNLLKNAVEALSVGGSIKVKTSSNFFMAGSHYIQIKISDTGPGIPPLVMETLFVPGNSTKGGGHTGSGLAITKKLIDEMNGQISCQSNQQGTCFILLFPITLTSKNKNQEGDNVS